MKSFALLLILSVFGVAFGLQCSEMQCGAGLSCCDSIIGGSQCYSPSSYNCLNGNALCFIENGVPDLVCGDACYTTDYTCCNEDLYGKDDVLNPCRPSSDTTIHPDFDAKVAFVSEGSIRLPQSVACSYGVQAASFPSYELFNCSSSHGAYGFGINESAVLLAFTLPLNANAYKSVTLNVYLDNEHGDDQQIAIAVFDELLSSPINISDSNVGASSCNLFSIVSAPLHYLNISVAAGFVGYKSIDVNTLLLWSIARNPLTSFQLSISTLSSCSASAGCICSAPEGHFVLSGKASIHPPQLAFAI